MSKTRILIGIIVLFHIVGLIGFFSPAWQPLFLKIVPFHLLLMLGVLVYSHQTFSVKFVYFILIALVFGFVIEWVGVHYHLVFGNYLYGKTLGPKLFDIPLMIGVNWFLLIYATGVFMQRTGLQSINARVILGALLLVLLDLLIEPVAIRFDYWHWVSGSVPFENYVGWFLVSGLMLGAFETFKFNKQSWVGAVLLISQFIFFGLMNRI